MKVPPTIKMMLEWIHQDIKELRTDVKQLQGFRWKVIGYSSACGAIVAILITLLF